ncbi:efflux transporter outer membrane subunit [bacterium]|nr:efflux transporter outer membrane subunit [bacterium]
MQNRISSFLILIGLPIFILMNACVLGPNYKKPKVDLSEKWSEYPQDIAVKDEKVLIEWWKIFNDPNLDSLIDQALKSNLDLKYATAVIRETREQRLLIISGALPSFNALGSYNRSKRSENITYSGSQGNFSTGTNNLFQAGFDANWEFNLFGGTQRALEAANATVQSTEESRNNILISLLSEIARNYFEVKELQLRLDKLDEIINTQNQIWELTQSKYYVGLVSKLDFIRAESDLNTLKSQRPGLEKAMKDGIHRICILLGEKPGTALKELESKVLSCYIVPEIPVGLPSDLLTRRPDVRRTERDLQAATAKIGVAKSLYFPHLSLTGTFGYQSNDLSKLLEGASKYWSFSPSLLLPIFESGKIRANVKIQEALQEQALITYQNTVLTALEDVENALVAYEKERERNSTLSKTVDAQKTTYDITTGLFESGITDRSEVLRSQMVLYQSQNQLIQSDFNVTLNIVALFKALGGGWEISSK